MTKRMDTKILKEIGLSDDELRAFFQKANQFFNTLTEKEKTIFRANLPAAEDAIETFNVEVTKEQLSEFIKKRETGHGDFACFINGTCKSKGDDD